MSITKQLVFGTKNCNCNRRRNDGLHNMNCASWKNAWFPKRLQRTRLTDLVATDSQSQVEPLKSAQSDPKRKANT